MSLQSIIYKHKNHISGLELAPVLPISSFFFFFFFFNDNKILTKALKCKSQERGGGGGVGWRRVFIWCMLTLNT